MKKTTFFVRIFDISAFPFTQIPIRRDRWMQNLILHPTSTHLAYFWHATLPQKQEIPEKNVMMTSSSRFLGISCFWVAGSIKSMQCGYSLDMKLNSVSNELSYLIFE